jgi:hypothetical protein
MFCENEKKEQAVRTIVNRNFIEMLLMIHNKYNAWK